MDKSNVTKFFRNVGTTVSKHSPEILTGIGLAGMVTTTILAVRSTPKALMLISEAEEAKGEALTAKEKVKSCWKCYIPAAATGAFSVACIIGASSVSMKRSAALATAYKLSETALTEYREKVIETIGEKKEHDIRDKVAKEKLEKNPVSKNEVLIFDKGDVLCYDVISEKYFKSDIQTIKAAVNTLNERMLREQYVSLNDLYEEIGLKSTKRGDKLGWNVSREGLIDIYYSSQLADDGTPCLVMDYEVAPKYDYYKL